MKINKQTEKLFEELVKSQRSTTKSLINSDYPKLIKETGMDLKSLAALLNIPYSKLLMYATKMCTIPKDIEEKLRKLIEGQRMSDEEQFQKMQEISDAAVNPQVKTLMQATGLSEKAVLNLKWSDIKDGVISCPTCGHKLNKPRKNQSESAKKASAENGRLGGRPKKK